MTASGPQADHEHGIRAACAAQRFEQATELALDVYAGELSGFLAARLSARADAEEVFSMVTEDLWRGLPGFAWRCSLRTWLYTLARSAIARYRLSPQARLRSHDTPTQLEGLVARARSATNVYQQTEVKDRFRLLREQLDEDDQTLLILRVDRNLAWRDLVVALTGETELDEASLKREGVRLRKAFERIKHTLRELARREGMLGSDD
jgi:RNA polymerase sigma-70 factor (ECF subfamily)